MTMTQQEALALVPLFSRRGYWVRLRPASAAEDVCLEVRDGALYGERARFELPSYALYFLMERGGGY